MLAHQTTLKQYQSFWVGYTKLNSNFNKVATEARELLPVLRDFRYSG